MTDQATTVADIDKERVSAPPPRRSAPPPKTPKRKTPRATSTASLGDIKAGLVQYAIMGSLWTAGKGDPAVALHIQEHSEALIDSWITLAETNTIVREALAALALAGPYSMAIQATIAFSAPIMEYYGRIPKVPMLEALGVAWIEPPEEPEPKEEGATKIEMAHA